MADDAVFKSPGSEAPLDDSRIMFAFAHDLRAHLRTVLTRIQLVQRGGGLTLPEGDQGMLQEAAAAAGDIGGLLNAMSAYLDAGLSEGQPGERQDLGLLLQGILLERKAALREAGAEVRVSKSDTAILAPAGLRHVLKELLTNACKFRDPGHALLISVAVRERADDSIEISVSDNGIGVPQQYLEKIFTPFQRLHPRDEFPGHALGLATCRRVVARWSGTIAAESQAERGLTVRVTFPSLA